MKRKIFLIAMLVAMAVSAEAQSKDPILIQNGFSTSGSMNLYLETNDMNDIADADDGAKWHLEKKNDVISFWIDIPPMKLYRISETRWTKDDAALVLNKMDNDLRMYIVANLQFRHLQIIEYEKNKWLVHLCSYTNE